MSLLPACQETLRRISNQSEQCLQSNLRITLAEDKVSSGTVDGYSLSRYQVRRDVQSWLVVPDFNNSRSQSRLVSTTYYPYPTPSLSDCNGYSSIFLSVQSTMSVPAMVVVDGRSIIAGRDLRTASNSSGVPAPTIVRICFKRAG
jgi:hypothetical protein